MQASTATAPVCRNLQQDIKESFQQLVGRGLSPSAVKDKTHEITETLIGIVINQSIETSQNRTRKLPNTRHTSQVKASVVNKIKSVAHM